MLPSKIIEDLKKEAVKYARFNWHQGWDKSSGYIKTELSDDVRYGACRIYIKWTKKKNPTTDQIKSAVEKAIDDLLENKYHHSTQKDFRYYVQNKYYQDVRRLREEVNRSIVEALPHVLKALEKYENFELPLVQELFNDLKNLEHGINDHEALERFLDEGRKRIGETDY